MTIELYILFIMSVLTFAVFGMDKHWATVQSRRVPEALLFALIVLDGDNVANYSINLSNC